MLEIYNEQVTVIIFSDTQIWVTLQLNKYQRLPLTYPTDKVKTL